MVNNKEFNETVVDTVIIGDRNHKYFALVNATREYRFYFKTAKDMVYFLEKEKEKLKPYEIFICHSQLGRERD